MQSARIPRLNASRSARCCARPACHAAVRFSACARLCQARQACTSASEESASCSASDERQWQGSLVTPSRRQTLAWLGAAALACIPQRGAAAEEASPARKVPKAYKEVVTRIITNLRDALNAEANGATEIEVRRKADPAKKVVQEFVAKWRDEPRVRGAASHGEVTAAIVELGAFYQKEGSRTRLSSGVRDSVLAHLAAAETALAAEERAGKQQGKGKGRQAQMQAEDVTNELLGVPSARTTSVYHAS